MGVCCWMSECGMILLCWSIESPANRPTHRGTRHCISLSHMLGHTRGKILSLLHPAPTKQCTSSLRAAKRNYMFTHNHYHPSIHFAHTFTHIRPHSPDHRPLSVAPPLTFGRVGGPSGCCLATESGLVTRATVRVRKLVGWFVADTSETELLACVVPDQDDISSRF